jgi:hypothetical protein
MRKFFVLFTLAIASAMPARAQQMYRCGNAFSQTPCGPNAAVIKSAGVPQPAGPVDPETKAAIEADCRQWIRNVPLWKDRESVRIGSIYRGEVEARKGRMLRSYLVMVSARSRATPTRRLGRCWTCTNPVTERATHPLTRHTVWPYSSPVYRGLPCVVA